MYDIKPVLIELVLYHTYERVLLFGRKSVVNLDLAYL